MHDEGGYSNHPLIVYLPAKILRTASQKKSQGSESSLAKSNMIDFAPDIYFVSKL